MRPLVGYARVSTVDQRPELQEDALEQAGCARIFTDKASGTRENRPALAECLDYVRPGDTLVVWRLDRLGRNMRHLVEVVNGLRDRGVEFRSLTEGFDTSTIGGQLVFHIFAALAEFERALIMERSAAGVAAARARGRVGGRPAKLTAAQRRSVRQLVAAKEQTVGSIAEQFGVSRGTVYRALEQAAAPDGPGPGGGVRMAGMTDTLYADRTGACGPAGQAVREYGPLLPLSPVRVVVVPRGATGRYDWRRR